MEANKQPCPGTCQNELRTGQACKSGECVRVTYERVRELCKDRNIKVMIADTAVPGGQREIGSARFADQYAKCYEQDNSNRMFPDELLAKIKIGPYHPDLIFDIEIFDAEMQKRVKGKPAAPFFSIRSTKPRGAPNPEFDKFIVTPFKDIKFDELDTKL
jgi:hypothetical protein